MNYKIFVFLCLVISTRSLSDARILPENSDDDSLVESSKVDCENGVKLGLNEKTENLQKLALISLTNIRSLEEITLDSNSTIYLSNDTKVTPPVFMSDVPFLLKVSVSSTACSNPMIRKVTIKMQSNIWASVKLLAWWGPMHLTGHEFSMDVRDEKSYVDIYLTDIPRGVFVLRGVNLVFCCR